MRPDEFFSDDVARDSWGMRLGKATMPLFRPLRSGSIPGHDDIEVAVPLARLIHDELEAFGTGGGNRMDDADMRDALLALRAVLDRLGVVGFNPPYQDFGTFRSYWLREGASGSWQARRDLLNTVFEGLHEQLAQIENKALVSTLVDPISPHERTGWGRVDTEISELRRHFLNARTPQDYRSVGNDCVVVTEALSAQVYDAEQHLREGESEPPVAKTKQRLERFIEDAAPGPENAELRKLARAVIEFAQAVKHSDTPTRREAGICADAVIQMANMLRRLAEDK